MSRDSVNRLPRVVVWTSGTSETGTSHGLIISPPILVHERYHFVRGAMIQRMYNSQDGDFRVSGRTRLLLGLNQSFLFFIKPTIVEFSILFSFF